MSGKFVVSKGRNGQDYFVLKASNGQVILQSEGYTTRRACAGGIRSVRANASKPERFESKKARNGKLYFVLKAGNGEIIGKSQMYKSASGCRNGIRSVGVNAADAEMVDNT